MILADLATVVLPAIDLRAELLTAKAAPGAPPLFLTGDTHWTQPAKVIAAAAVARWVRSREPALPLPAAPQWIVEAPVALPFIPDLVRMLGFRIVEGQIPRPCRRTCSRSSRSVTRAICDGASMATPARSTPDRTARPRPSCVTQRATCRSDGSSQRGG